MLNSKKKISFNSASVLGTSGILAMSLFVSACGKSVTVKNRGSVSPAKTVPGAGSPAPKESSKPSVDDAGKATEKSDSSNGNSSQSSQNQNPSDSQSGDGAVGIQNPSAGGSNSGVGTYSVGQVILTDQPKLGDSLAVDCDKERVAAQEKFLRSSGLAAELSKTIDPVVSKLDEASWAELVKNSSIVQDTAASDVQKKAAKDQINTVLRQGYVAAGLRTVAPDFAAVSTKANDSSQTYLGIWRDGPVLASVKRQRTLGNHLLVTKLNWSPVKETYLVSAQVFQVRTGKKLTAQGIPSQTLYVGKPVGGSLLVYLDLTQVSRDCKGVTAMTVEEQVKFSTLPVARFAK